MNSRNVVGIIIITFLIGIASGLEMRKQQKDLKIQELNITLESVIKECTGE